MRRTRVEDRKKVSVRQIEASGCKVGQCVGRARNVEPLRNVSMGPLVLAGGAEQVGRRARSGDGASGTPGNSRGIVAESGYGELPEVVVLGQRGNVSHSGDEFQVRVGDGALGVLVTDYGGLYGGGKGSRQT